MPRKPYPTDVSDKEWSFAGPYLTLMEEAAPQRRHDLREAFNALRWLVCAGAPWRLLPNDFPPWEAVYQQSRRWVEVGCFEALVCDLRSIIRVAQGRQGQRSAMVLDGRTLQSSMRPGRRRALDKTRPADALIDRLEKLKAGIRAKVEHPFRVIKRQFGHVKVRYRGLRKNTAQLFTLFALSNLWMARGKLLAMQA